MNGLDTTFGLYSCSMRFLPLFLLLLLVAGVYAYRLGDKPLDFDERYTINIATGLGGTAAGHARVGEFIVQPLPTASFTADDYWQRFRVGNTVSAAISDNGHAIPYYVLLHTWIGALGMTVAHARWLSLIFLLMSVAALYPLALKVSGNRRIALLTVILFAFNGLVIGLGQYARFYTLGLFLSIVSTGMVWNRYHEQASFRRSFALGLLWGLFIVNQFFATLVVVAQGLFLLSKRSTAAERARWISGAFCGFAVVFLVWLLPLHGWESLRNLFLFNKGMSGGPKVVIGPVANVYNMVLALLADIATAFGQPTGIENTTKTWVCILLVLPVIASLAAIRAFPKDSPQRSWLRLTLWVLGVHAVAAIIHSLLIGYTLLFISRYWVLCLPFASLLTAMALYHGFKMGNRFQVVVVIAGLLLAVRIGFTTFSTFSGLVLDGTFRMVPDQCLAYPDEAALAKTIAAQMAPGDTVCYRTWLLAQRTNWYLRDHPQIRQRVDTLLAVPVAIKNGAAFHPLLISKGRPQAARAPWHFAAGYKKAP